MKAYRVYRTLRVQVPNYHILSYITTYPKPKYLIIGSFGPLGKDLGLQFEAFGSDIQLLETKKHPNPKTVNPKLALTAKWSKHRAADP